LIASQIKACETCFKKNPRGDAERQQPDLATNTSSSPSIGTRRNFVRVYLTYDQFGQGSLVSVRRLINASQPATSQAGGSPIAAQRGLEHAGGAHQTRRC